MSDTAVTAETRAQIGANNWAGLAADAHVEIASLHSGNGDPVHRTKVREAHERALARGSDFL